MIFTSGGHTYIDGDLKDAATGVSLVKSGVKRYRALITQSGTDAPTAEVLENTLGFVPTFTRQQAGVYYLVGPSGAFPASKTFMNNPLTYSNTDDICIVWFTVVNGDDTRLSINVYDLMQSSAASTSVTSLSTDGTLFKTPFEIVVYP